MLKFSRMADAFALCRGYTTLYPGYKFIPEKPRGCRKWRIMIQCKATGAFLTFAKA